MTLFGLPGMPDIYYGDEILLAGRIEDIEGCRFPMDWSVPLEGRKKETFALYQALSALKKNAEALHHGGFKIMYARGKVFAFARFTEDDVLLFIWSVCPEPETISIEAGEFGLPEKTVSVRIGSIGAWEISGSELRLQVRPHESAVLQLA